MGRIATLPLGKIPTITGRIKEHLELTFAGILLALEWTLGPELLEFGGCGGGSFLYSFFVLLRVLWFDVVPASGAAENDPAPSLGNVLSLTLIPALYGEGESGNFAGSNKLGCNVVLSVHGIVSIVITWKPVHIIRGFGESLDLGFVAKAEWGPSQW